MEALTIEEELCKKIYYCICHDINVENVEAIFGEHPKSHTYLHSILTKSWFWKDEINSYYEQIKELEAEVELLKLSKV